MQVNDTDDDMKKAATSLVEKVLRFAVSKLFVERLLTNAKLVVTGSKSPQETTSSQSCCSNIESKTESNNFVHVSEKSNLDTEDEGQINKKEQIIDPTDEPVKKNVESTNNRNRKNIKSFKLQVKPDKQCKEVSKISYSRGDSDIIVDNRSSESGQSGRYSQSVQSKRKQNWSLRSERKSDDQKQKETAASDGTYSREKSTATSKKRRAVHQHEKSDKKAIAAMEGRETFGLAKNKVSVASKKELVDTKEKAKTGKNRRALPITLLPKNGIRKTRPLNDEQKESCKSDKLIAANERKVATSKTSKTTLNLQGKSKNGWTEQYLPQPKRVWVEQSKHSSNSKSSEETTKEHKGMKKCLPCATDSNCEPIADIKLKKDSVHCYDPVSQHGSYCNDVDGVSNSSFTSLGSVESLSVSNDPTSKVIQNDESRDTNNRTTEIHGTDDDVSSTIPIELQSKKNEQKSSLLKSFARDRAAEKNGLIYNSRKIDDLGKEEKNQGLVGKCSHLSTSAVYSYNLNGDCHIREKSAPHIQQDRTADVLLDRPKATKQWKMSKTNNSCLMAASAVPIPPHGKSKNSYKRLSTNLLSIDERGLDLRSVPVSSKPVASYWRKSSIFNRVYAEKDKRLPGMHKTTHRLPNLLSTSQQGVYSEKEQFVCCSAKKESARKHSSDSDGRVSETYSEDSGYETVPSLKDPKTKEVKGRERFMKFSLTKASRNMSIIEEEKYKLPCYQILSNERRKRSIAYDKKRRSKSLWQLQNAKKSKENRRKTIQLVIAENGSTKF